MKSRALSLFVVGAVCALFSLSLPSSSFSQSKEPEATKEGWFKKWRAKRKYRICSKEARERIERLGELTATSGEVAEVIDGFKLGIPGPVTSTLRITKLAHQLLERRNERVCDSGKDKKLGEEFEACLARAESIKKQTEQLIAASKALKSKKEKLEATEELLGQMAALQEALRCGDDAQAQQHDPTLGGTSDAKARAQSLKQAKTNPVEFLVYEACQPAGSTDWGPCTKQTLGDNSKISPAFQVLNEGESLHVYVIAADTTSGVAKLFPARDSTTTKAGTDPSRLSHPIELDANGGQWEHIYLVASRHQLPALDALTPGKYIPLAKGGQHVLGLVAAHAQYPAGIGQRLAAKQRGVDYADERWGGYAAPGYLTKQQAAEPFAVFRISYFHD